MKYFFAITACVFLLSAMYTKYILGNTLDGAWLLALGTLNFLLADIAFRRKAV